ncbi:MAG: tRNA pseudouridine(38-40) synthase TruA [Candidatus Kapabacteria bacterium]|nr:tRNA pseudouridine(38-40) synthase TruA [Candidatus Kapabacteria bacterium]
MQRCALLIEYDGLEYAGWQRQTNALTVQEVLERGIERIVGVPVNVISAGRTDAGVHGFGQVAHVDVPETCRISDVRLAKAFNSCLPRDVRVRAAKRVSGNFHARFQATRREYRYTLTNHYSVFRRRYAWQQTLAFDASMLNSAAEIFLGKHDFTSFSKLNHDTESYICAVEEARWNEVESGVWHFHVAADRFVYGMVRSLVGAMMDAALHKVTPDDLREALEHKERSLRTTPLAPAQGLVLWRVQYDDDPFAGLW